MKDGIQINPNWENADYIVVNRTYAVLFSNNEYKYISETYDLIHEICSYGNVVCEVWKK